MVPDLLLNDDVVAFDEEERVLIVSFLPKSLSRVLWTSAAGIDRDARQIQRLGAILDNVAHIASISCANVFLPAVIIGLFRVVLNLDMKARLCAKLALRGSKQFGHGLLQSIFKSLVLGDQKCHFAVGRRSKMSGSSLFLLC